MTHSLWDIFCVMFTACFLAVWMLEGIRHLSTFIYERSRGNPDATKVNPLSVGATVLLCGPVVTGVYKALRK